MVGRLVARLLVAEPALVRLAAVAEPLAVARQLVAHARRHPVVAAQPQPHRQPHRPLLLHLLVLRQLLSTLNAPSSSVEQTLV